MIVTKTEKEYCMVCGNENPSDQEICKCGGRNFVFGNNFSYDNKKVICGCGNEKFSLKTRINMNPIYNKTYMCSECKNVIGVQIYYESPYLSE